MQRSLLLYLILALFVVIFTIQNAAGVPVKLFVWEIELPLALIIVAALLLGALLGIFFSAFGQKRKQKKTETREEPVANEQNADNAG